MTARSKRNSIGKRCGRRLTCCDMFGYKIGFNVEGEEHHRTLPGACLSLIIFMWCIMLLNTWRNGLPSLALERPLTFRNYENYFG